MGLTKQYLRHVYAGQCNAVGSVNGAIIAVDNNVCGVTACENVNFYNFRTGDKVASLSECTKQVTCVKINSNKRFLAIGYADGSIRLFDRHAEDQTECITFSGHKKGVNCLAFSHDGLTLASGGKDCSIILWDIVAESGLFRLNGHKESVTHLEFTKNDKFVISSCKDTFVKFWDIASQSCFFTLTENRSEVYSFVLLKNDSLLITASSEMELYVFDVTWLGDDDKIEKSSETPEAKRVKELGGVGTDLANCENKYVRVTMRGKVLRQCKGRALQLTASPDGTLLACLGSDRLVDFFRVYSDDEAKKRLTKKLRKAKRKAADSGEDAAPTADDVARDVTVILARIGEWRAASKPKWMDFCSSIEQGETEADVVYKAFCLFVNNSVQCIETHFNTGTNEISVKQIGDLDRLGHREDVRSLSVASHDSLIASGGGNQVMLWNAESMRAVNTLIEEGMSDVTAVHFATGDKHVMAGTKSGEIYLFDISSCECSERRQAHDGAIWTLTKLPDGSGFISASADKKVKFWSYDIIAEGDSKRLTIRERRVLELPDEALSAAISPDGKFLVVGLLDTTAAVYFVDSLKFYLSLYGHSLPVTCCTVSPDSKLVVTGSADKSIKIWGLDFGDCHKSFHAHDDVVSCVLFSPSDEMLVWSAGRDGKIKQWDAAKFEKVQTLDRHTAEIRCLAQTTNGGLLFSASHDRSIRSWEGTEEIVVLQEEEEMEREKDYELRLEEDEDIVPGETEGEAALAEKKSEQTIVSTENIIDAIDIVRKERVAMADDPEHTPHPLYLAYRSKSLDHFVLDVIARIRASHLDRALLMLPLTYVPDVLQSLAACVQKRYKVEFASRVAVFLIRIHHSHIINNVEMVPVVDLLRSQLPAGIDAIRDIACFNLAALNLLAAEVEENQQVRIFADLSEVAEKTKKMKKTKKAVIKTVAA